MDSNQSFTDISFRDAKELIRFWSLWSHFKVTGDHRRLKCLYALYHLVGQMDFKHTAQIYLSEVQKTLMIFCDLDPICKVIEGQRILKNSLSLLDLLNGWMDFNHTCRENWLGHGKNWSYFGDLDLIFQGTGGQRRLKIALFSSYLPKVLIDSCQT